MSKTIYAGDSFNPVEISFKDNTVCYNDNYLTIVTNKCIVYHINEDYVWIIVDDTLKNIICAVDGQFIQYRSKNYDEYLAIADSMHPSLKLSVKGEHNLLKFTKRNAELYGTIIIGEDIRIVLTAQYNNNTILWRAHKILCHNDSNNEEFLQDCRLDQNFINI